MNGKYALKIIQSGQQLLHFDLTLPLLELISCIIMRTVGRFTVGWMQASSVI